MKSKIMHVLLAIAFGLGFVSVHAASDWTVNLTNGSTTGPSPSIPAVYGYSAINITSLLNVNSVANHGNGYGLGMYAPNSTDDSHTLDNSGYQELLVLKFSQAVTLSELTIGWSGGKDSDISVLRYTGSYSGGSTPIDTSASKYNNLLSQGWALVGQYSNMNPDGDAIDKPEAINAAGVGSSYWLIAAYNSVFDSTQCIANSVGTKSCGNGNDYVKLLSVGGIVTKPPGEVSEPAALLLMGTALFGMAGFRRRQSGK